MKKKLLLSLGTLATSTLPIVAVISCSEKDLEFGFKEPETVGKHDITMTNLVLPDPSNATTLTLKAALDSVVEDKVRTGEHMDLYNPPVFDRTVVNHSIQKALDYLYAVGVLRHFYHVSIEGSGTVPSSSFSVNVNFTKTLPKNPPKQEEHLTDLLPFKKFSDDLIIAEKRKIYEAQDYVTNLFDDSTFKIWKGKLAHPELIVVKVLPNNDVITADETYEQVVAKVNKYKETAFW